MLFQSEQSSSPQTTSMAYKLRYFPMRTLSAGIKSFLVWRDHMHLSKARILESMNEELTEIVWKGETFKIVWAFNNIPTEREWNKIPMSTMINCDFRISPVTAIPTVIFELEKFERNFL